MDVIKRADVPQVSLRTEQVTVEALGGDVVVRGRMLADTLRLASLRTGKPTPKNGESEDDAKVRAGAEYVAAVLAAQVVDADGEPVFAAAQWSMWGGSHPQDVIRLHEACERVCGGDEEAAKKN